MERPEIHNLPKRQLIPAAHESFQTHTTRTTEEVGHNRKPNRQYTDTGSRQPEEIAFFLLPGACGFYEHPSGEY